MLCCGYVFCIFPLRVTYEQETKSRNKNKKKQKVKSGGDLQLVEGLFAHPERELYGESSCFDEDAGIKL